MRAVVMSLVVCLVVTGVGIMSIYADPLTTTLFKDDFLVDGDLHGSSPQTGGTWLGGVSSPKISEVFWIQQTLVSKHLVTLSLR